MGETAGFDTYQQCWAINANVVPHIAKFSDFTPDSLVNAFHNLEDVNIARLNKVYDAVRLQLELMLRAGAAFTAFKTVVLRQSLPQIVGNVSRPCICILYY